MAEHDPMQETPRPSPGMFFCGICGYTQHASTAPSATLSCCRCLMGAHLSCFRVTNNERLPPPHAAARAWTCACCEAKISEFNLSTSASVFSKKVSRIYNCLFCDPGALRRCPKQLHVVKVQCGLWAHSVCHLLGNEAFSDEPAETAEAAGEVAAPRAMWRAGMVVKVGDGLHSGEYAILQRPPLADSRAELQLRKWSSSFPSSSSSSSSEGGRAPQSESFFADCADLQPGVPRRKDMALVLAGRLRGFVGRVKAVYLEEEGEEEVVLENVLSGAAVDSVPLRCVAWMDLRGISTAGGRDSTPAEPASATEAAREGGAAAACLLCGQGGEALVRCGETGCAALLHVPCALPDPSCSVQLAAPQTPAQLQDHEAAQIDVQFMLHCPQHRKSFDPSDPRQQQAQAQASSTQATTVSSNSSITALTSLHNNSSVASDTSSAGLNERASAEHKEVHSPPPPPSPRGAGQALTTASTATSISSASNSSTSSSSSSSNTSESTRSRGIMVADCTGCGKQGLYVVTIVTSSATGVASSRGKPVVFKRCKEHRLTGKETATGRPKYCGTFSLNPRPADEASWSAGGTAASNVTRITSRVEKLPVRKSHMIQIAARDDDQESDGDYLDAKHRSRDVAAVGRQNKGVDALPPPPALTTFAPGMDPGECTVQAQWEAPPGQELDEADIRSLFCPLGHVFRLEMVEEGGGRGVARVYYSERKAALTAVTKFRNFTHDPSSSTAATTASSSSSGRGGGLKKQFRLCAGHLGARVFVGGLDAATSESKIKKAFQACGYIESLEHVGPKCLAFVTFRQLSSARAAVETLHQRKVPGVSTLRAGLTVAIMSITASTTTADRLGGGGKSSNDCAGWVIDRGGERGAMSPPTSASVGKKRPYQDQGAGDESSHMPPRIFAASHSPPTRTKYPYTGGPDTTQGRIIPGKSLSMISLRAQNQQNAASRQPATTMPTPLPLTTAPRSWPLGRPEITTVAPATSRLIITPSQVQGEKRMAPTPHGTNTSIEDKVHLDDADDFKVVPSRDPRKRN